MKQCIIIFAVLIASVNTLLAKVKNPVTETRKVEAFQTLKLSTVGTVYLTQGDNYSLRFEGEEEYVKQNRSNVTDGVLSIDCSKDRNGKSLVKNKNGVIIYITAPDLKEITFNGVGSQGIYINQNVEATFNIGYTNENALTNTGACPFTGIACTVRIN